MPDAGHNQYSSFNKILIRKEIEKIATMYHQNIKPKVWNAGMLIFLSKIAGRLKKPFKDSFQ